MDENRLIELYQGRFGVAPTEVTPLPPSGSNRRYYRLSAPAATVVGCCGTDTAENRDFMRLTDFFSGRSLPVPQIVARSADDGCYLMDDLGTCALFDFITPGRERGEWTPAMEEVLAKTISRLPDFQFAMAEDGVSPREMCGAAPMDRRLVDWDLNYFKYCFAKVVGLEVDDRRLQDDFDRLTEQLLEPDGHIPAATFMYRDFQSRNVMLVGDDSAPYFIDYQSGRQGPIYYDVASFLWQAKARFPEALRQRLIDCYLESARRYIALDAEQFRRRLMLFVLFRQLQTLGAYGFRGLIEHKAHFVESIPFALENASRLVADGTLEPFPYIKELLARAAALPQFARTETPGRLRVTVTSFSYKRGIPADYSGNGGGFVFDCRALHNPGRYAEYRQLTGRDAAVIEFLEERGEIQPFLDAVYRLVDASVERYRQRGFTSLQISFGCTGGRHRSVYSAEHTARHIHSLFPDVEVQLCHREQNIYQAFPAV